MQVVCAWIGNSQPVAAKHYLQVTEDHFRKAVQNPVQYPTELACMESQVEPADGAEPAFCGPMRRPAADCKSCQPQHLPLRGVEPLSPG